LKEGGQKMKTGLVKAYLIKFTTRYSEGELRRAEILLGIQIVFVLLMSTTSVLVILFDNSDRRVLYLSLDICLLTILVTALILNLQGKYKVSAWLTIIAMILGPWVSILLDETVIKGDFVPLIFIALSIQLCSILLSEGATIFIAAFQLCSYIPLVLLNPNLMVFNWASLIIFFFFTTALGVVASFVTRKQMEQIERDKSEIQKDKIQLRILSERDSLTGLYNRGYMKETLEREISRAIRKNQDLGVVMVDIDYFKNINDTFGHAMGDYVICGVADILNNSIRKSDVACRFGGDEFILILPECSLIKTKEIVETIREAIKNNIFCYGERHLRNLSLSFGIAVAPENGLYAEEILKVADDTLYAEKKEGRTELKKIDWD
jgi:diguanylate cyclase (GGDEF)-like protein